MRNLFSAILIAIVSLFSGGARSADQSPGLRFEISFPASLRSQPVTGRMFVKISRRQESGGYGSSTPIFGVDVDQLKPDQPAVIDAGTLGSPTHSLRDIPPGDYYVQAVLNIYTDFHRSDGHTVWAHMDQWEGQHFDRSPGNLVSEVRKVPLDSQAGYDLKLVLAKPIPAVVVPPDTSWVKRVKFQSKLLSQFWGHPIYIGATVLLPKGYDNHPDLRYPVIYSQGHFTLQPPYGFRTQEKENEGASPPPPGMGVGMESGYEFYQAWNSENFPRLIIATFQHPTPYYDDSYAVNSANNGPYGDALITELIPYLEEHFRIMKEPKARVLTGGSTGGWESLALQLYHPDFFGGTWTFNPDPIDFRRYGIINIYEDENAFVAPGHEWTAPERAYQRFPDGQVLVTQREMSQREAVLGSKGRSCGQLEIWEAVYGPVGDDGYPKPLWDKITGKIDHQVANYMREHGYDLRYYAETNWPQIGPKLAGKLNLICGDMDHFYLNLAVYLMEDFLEATKNPYYAGSFQYGRKIGHGWNPLTNAGLVRRIAEHIGKNLPASRRAMAASQ